MRVFIFLVLDCDTLTYFFVKACILYFFLVIKDDHGYISKAAALIAKRRWFILHDIERFMISSSYILVGILRQAHLYFGKASVESI